MLSVGIDLGGTKTNFGLLEIRKEKFKILKQTTISSPHKKEELVQAVRENIKKIIVPGVKKIGLAQAGIIDINQKINLLSPNLKALEHIDFARLLQKEFKIRIFLDNDTNAFILAEATYGACRDKKKAVGLTLGTGIGGGLVIDGKLYHGICTSATEFGHMIIDYNGRKCSCGQKGCLEAYASATAIIQEYENRTGFRRDAYAIEEEAKSGLEPAQSIFTEASNYLAVGLANIINILEPETIVLGGGLSEVANFVDLAIHNTKKFTLKGLGECVKIVKAKLGREAGMIGAALLDR
ncbi:MAG: ROK family protein [Candidatus Doudnabacteria bacterium]